MSGSETDKVKRQKCRHCGNEIPCGCWPWANESARELMDDDLREDTYGAVAKALVITVNGIKPRLSAAQREITRYREALEKIASGARYSMYDKDDCFKGLGECRDIARAALSPPSQQEIQR